MKKNYRNPYLKVKPTISRPYTFLYLIRHCQPNYSLVGKVPDAELPLSAIGCQQRNYLDKRLLLLNIDKVYASELLRAQQTAENFVKKINKKLIIDHRLNEINWNKWYKIKYFNVAEKSRAKRFKYYSQMDKRLDKKQLYLRHFLKDIYLQNKGKRVALFCHGNLTRAILTSIIGADIIGFLSMEIYQSSVSKIVIDRDGYVKINYINNIRHLPHQPKEDLFYRAISQ